MCWLDEFYKPEQGAPCLTLISRIVGDALPKVMQEREQEEARQRVELKRRLRRAEALSERLLDEIEQLKEGA